MRGLFAGREEIEITILPNGDRWKLRQPRYSETFDALRIYAQNPNYCISNLKEFILYSKVYKE
jgi:hypothetical protein